MNPWSPVLTRDGHLSALAIDRYLYDPPDEGLASAIERHAQACSSCRERLAEVRQSDAAVVLLPPHPATRPGAPVVRSLKPRSWTPLAAGAGLVLAATLAFLALPPQPSPDDGLRLKGARTELEVYVHDGQRARQVDSRDLVHAGDRAGFRLHLAQAAHVLVLGVDDEGHVYKCHPQDDLGLSRRYPGETTVTLQEAVRFDAVPGHERLVLLACQAPIALGEAEPRLAGSARRTPAEQPLALVRQDCVQREVVLTKAPASSGPSPGGAR